jgi:cytochrome c553
MTAVLTKGSTVMREASIAELGCILRLNACEGLRHVRSILIVAGALFAMHEASAQTDRARDIITKAIELPAHPVAGARTYAAHCAECHGRDAQGNASTVTPALAGQVLSYLLKQLVDMSDADRPVQEMHRLMARPEVHAPQNLRDLATHLSSLRPIDVPEVGDGTRLEVGERIYNSICLQCHGPRGRGNYQRMVPALRGQHYSYLLMQARQMAVGHRYGVDVEVIDLLEALTFEELAAVSDYISRLRVEQPLDESVARQTETPW